MGESRDRVVGSVSRHPFDGARGRRRSTPSRCSSVGTNEIVGKGRVAPQSAQRSRLDLFLFIGTRHGRRAGQMRQLRPIAAAFRTAQSNIACEEWLEILCQSLPFSPPSCKRMPPPMADHSRGGPPHSTGQTL